MKKRFVVKGFGPFVFAYHPSNIPVVLAVQYATGAYVFRAWKFALFVRVVAREQ